MFYIPEVHSSNRPLVTRICIWDVKKAVPQRCFYKTSILKINSKPTGEHPYGNVISIKLQITCNCPVNLLHFLRIPFRKNTSDFRVSTWVLLIRMHISFTSPHWITVPLCFPPEPFFFQLSFRKYFFMNYYEFFTWI